MAILGWLAGTNSLCGCSSAAAGRGWRLFWSHDGRRLCTMPINASGSTAEEKHATCARVDHRAINGEAGCHCPMSRHGATPGYHFGVLCSVHEGLSAQRCGARDWQVSVPTMGCVKPRPVFVCPQCSVRHEGIHIEVCNSLCGPLQGDPHGGGAAGRSAARGIENSTLSSGSWRSCTTFPSHAC